MKGAPASNKAAVDARTLVAHVLAVAAIVLVLLWCIHFRGGLALRSQDKPLIFNVHPVLMVLGPIRSIVRRSAAVPSPSICRASASSTAATPSLSGRWQGNMCSKPEWPPLP